MKKVMVVFRGSEDRIWKSSLPVHCTVASHCVDTRYTRYRLLRRSYQESSDELTLNSKYRLFEEQNASFDGILIYLNVLWKRCFGCEML